MTEPQPWPTTVQRRQESGDTDSATDVPASESAASDLPTPRHGRPAGAAAPSPFPRQRGADVPTSQGPGHPRPTHVRDVVGPRTSPAPTGAPAVVARDSGAMRALRVVTYLLVSLASLVFLALVVYGGIRYGG